MTSSVLTDSQRDYVLGKNSPSNPRVYKRRIRDRVEAGLRDYSLLFEHYDDEEIREIFGEPFAQPVDAVDEAKGDIPELPAAPSYVPGTIAFLLRGLNYGEEPIIPGLGEQQPAFKHFIEAVEAGVQRYLTQEAGVTGNVNVTIELEDLQPSDDLIEQIEEDS